MPAWGEDKIVLCKHNTVVNERGDKIMSQFTIVGIFGYHVRLHWFYKGDGEWFHDHPRAFYTLCLLGSYHEKIWPKGGRVVKPGTISVVKPKRAHSVTPLKKPCVTLVWATPVLRKFKKWRSEDLQGGNDEK